MVHTILGAGGPVSNALTTQLLKNNKVVRLGSRRKVDKFPNAQWMHTDLLDFKKVISAVKGSDIVYMCAGLKYDKKIWAKEWPVITENLVNALKETGARLVFFDNVYMYGRVEGPMTENTPYNPCSLKGEVRAKVAERIMKEVKSGNINATIARAADFYGAETLNSVYDSMVLKNFSKKAKAMWLGNPEALHSFTYVPDAGKAMYLLGQKPDSANQIWHVPTAPALVGKEFINIAAEIFNTKLSYMRVSKFMLQTLGFFSKQMNEVVETYYQFQYDYNFNSDKFEKEFGVLPTPYKNGIADLKDNFYKV